MLLSDSSDSPHLFYIVVLYPVTSSMIPPRPPPLRHTCIQSKIYKVCASDLQKPRSIKDLQQHYMVLEHWVENNSSMNWLVSEHLKQLHGGFGANRRGWILSLLQMAKAPQILPSWLSVDFVLCKFYLYYVHHTQRLCHVHKIFVRYPLEEAEYKN